MTNVVLRGIIDLRTGGDLPTTNSDASTNYPQIFERGQGLNFVDDQSSLASIELKSVDRKVSKRTVLHKL